MTEMTTRDRWGRRVLLAVGVAILAILLWPKSSQWGTPADGSFRVPDAAQRSEAVGNLEDAPATDKLAFEPSSTDFQAIPNPGRSDWLAQQMEIGQTFEQYRRFNPNRPDESRNIIYVQPLGGFDETNAPRLDKLVEFASTFFSLPVKLLPAVPVEKLPAKRRIRLKFGTQLLSTDVLEWMRSRVPDDAYCLLAVTMSDLYPDPAWNYVFGQASLGDRVGVYSFARYQSGLEEMDAEERNSVQMLRSCKVLAHETGHMFGIKHCVHFHCLMNGSNHLEETDRAPIHLCPVCLRKLHWAKSFDLAKRYRKLESLSVEFAWHDQQQWYENRAAAIESVEATAP